LRDINLVSARGIPGARACNGGRRHGGGIAVQQRYSSSTVCNRLAYAEADAARATCHDNYFAS
jgi:hypothetical protein